VYAPRGGSKSLLMTESLRFNRFFQTADSFRNKHKEQSIE